MLKGFQLLIIGMKRPTKKYLKFLLKNRKLKNRKWIGNIDTGSKNILAH